MTLCCSIAKHLLAALLCRGSIGATIAWLAAKAASSDDMQQQHSSANGRYAGVKQLPQSQPQQQHCAGWQQQQQQCTRPLVAGSLPSSLEVKWLEKGAAASTQLLAAGGCARPPTRCMMQPASIAD
jgi:hypothetical protein